MTASPNVANYSLGKGKVYFARLNDDGTNQGELDLGNAPAFNMNTTQETLDHFESMAGIKEKDLQVETSIGSGINFTLDEYSKENLALAFRAEEPTTESQSGGSVAAESVTMYTGKWVKVLYRNISNVVIAGAVEGTDFEVDFATGRIKAIVGGTLVDATAVNVAYDYSSEEWGIVNGISNGTSIEGFLRFVGNPEQGPKYEIEIWKVKIRSTADLPFISDDWGTIQFEGEIQKDVANHPNYPWFKIREEGTAGGGS